MMAGTSHFRGSSAQNIWVTLGDSAIHVGSRRVLPRRDANPRIRWPFDRLGAHAGRSAAFLGVMDTTFGRRIFARASDCGSPPCKGGVLIGAPTTDGGGVKGVHVARACVAVQHRISVREGPTAEALPEPQALREARQDLGSAPVGATDPSATAEDVLRRHARARLGAPGGGA